jgi:hypothetical protein
LLAGGTLCSDCAYSQWGYWGGEVTSGAGSSLRTDLAHLNFWVAGQPTVTPPTVGTGTYRGSSIGSVYTRSGGILASYIATGSFILGYNFGTNTGTYNGTFDGIPLLGTVHATGNSGGEYSSLAGGSFGAAGYTGSVTGKFFGPGTPETGGNFTLQSTSNLFYQAAGVFLGHR